MNTVRYSAILSAAIARAGLPAAREVDGFSELQETDAELLREGASLGLATLWRAGTWPETRRVEQRRFRNTWLAATAYVARSEVYHLRSGKYAIALRASTNEEPYDSSGTLNTAYWAELKFGYSGNDWLSTTTYSTLGTIVRYLVDGFYYALHTAASVATVPTNTTYWGRLISFDPYILHAQTGQTVIETPFNVWRENPDAVTGGGGELPFTESRNGVQVLASPLPAEVWLEFRGAPPQLTGATLDLTATYAVDEQVYFATTTNGAFASDFYTVATATSAAQTPATHASKFSVVEIPARFRTALIHFSAAHWLRAQGATRRDDADREESMAFSALGAELARLRSQSGQRTRITLH